MVSRWLDCLKDRPIGYPINLQSFLEKPPYRALALVDTLGLNLAKTLKWAVLEFLTAP